jgi:hypothetical protein
MSCHKNNRTDQCLDLERKPKWATKLLMLQIKKYNFDEKYNLQRNIFNLLAIRKVWRITMSLKAIEIISNSSYPCPSCVPIFNRKSTELWLRGFHFRTWEQGPGTYGWKESKKHICRANHTCIHILYILESNPHPFYSFRGLKNQMRIRFAI